jgi:hypothetical protein
MTGFRIAIATLSAALVAACAVDETGDLHVSLTGTGRYSGTVYRLRNAELIVSGGGATRVYSTEVDPDRTVITTPLPTGEYTLRVPDGWFLERRQGDGTFDAVPATMSTPNPQGFAIADHRSTNVTLRFLVGGEEVSLDEGTLTVDLSIDEVDTEIPSGPVASGDDMLPGEILPAGSSLRTSDNAVELRLGSDGDLVLHGPNGLIGWSAGTAGRGGTVLLMQSDGNLVLYRDDGSPVWESETVLAPSYLLLESVGGFVGSVSIYRSSNQELRWRHSFVY